MLWSGVFSRSNLMEGHFYTLYLKKQNTRALFSAFYYQALGKIAIFSFQPWDILTKYFLLPWQWKLRMRQFSGGVKSQGAELQTTEDYSQELKLNVYSVGFDIDSFLPSTVFHLEWNVYDCYPMLSYCCISGADHLFCTFINTQIRKNFAPRCLRPRISPTPGLDDEIRDFCADYQVRIFTFSCCYNGWRLWRILGWDEYILHVGRMWILIMNDISMS